MGLYIIEEDEDIKSKQERNLEIDEIVRDTFDIIKNIKDESLPPFLFNVQLNEFDFDEYKIRGSCTDENVQRVYSLQRKYSTYWDYSDAMEIYNEYVRYIDEHFGSFEMMKNAAEDGYSGVYIPREPKLKNKKQNRLLIRSGYIPSRKDEDFDYDENEDILDKCLSSYSDITKFEELDEESEGDKDCIKSLEDAKDKHNRTVRKSSVYASSSRGHDKSFDAIVRFLNGANDNNIESRSIQSDTDSLTSTMNSLYLDELMTEEDKAAMCISRQAYIEGGKIVNRTNEKMQLELLEELERNGYSFLESSVTKGLSKNAVRALNRKFSNEVDLANLSPKEKKKALKAIAKRRAKEQKQVAGNRRMQALLLNNRANISSNNLNFRISDLYND